MRKQRFLLVAFLIVTIALGFSSFYVPTVEASPDTFGKTDVGASQSSSGADYIRGSYYTCPEAGDATQISWYAKGVAGGNFRIGLWRKSDGVAVFLSDSIAVVADWNHVTISPSVGVTNQDYKLGVVWSANQPRLAYDAGDGFYLDHTFNGLPNPLTGESADAKDYSIYVTYTPSGEEHTFNGVINQQFSLTSTRVWTFIRLSQISPQFTVSSQKLPTFNRFGTITQTFSVASLKGLTFNLFSTIQPTFTIASTAEFIGAGILNFHGTITQVFTVDFLKAMSLNRFGTINPTFTIDGTAPYTQMLNLFATVAQVFTTTFMKGLTFNPYGTINPTFTVSGTFEIPGLLNLYGIINFVFDVMGYTPLAPIIEEISPYWIIALGVAVSASTLATLAIALNIRGREES